MSLQPAVYITANKSHSTLYVGVTSNLAKRIFIHKQQEYPCFTKKYKCIYLVYYEFTECMLTVIAREKQLKAGSREKKINLIQNMNPQWKDLYKYITA
jgi:putative endonuclease